jgi:predicted MFS family arabinose efflux permease
VTEDLRRLIADARSIALDARSRRLLLFVYCLDAPFAFVFLIALQSYFTPQQLAGRAVPGLALALFSAGKLALQYQGGRVTDRLGPARTLSLGLACIAIALAMLLAAPSLPALVLLASLVYGIGSACAWPALLGQAHALPAAWRGSLTAAMTAATGVGGVSALLLGLVLPESLPFRVAIAIALAAVGLALKLSLGVAPTPERTNEVIEPASRTRAGVRPILAQRAYLALGSAFLLQSLALAALLASFRAIGRDLMGVSLHRETILLLPVGASFGVGVLVAGVLGRLSRRASLAAGLALGGASFLAVSHATGQPLQIGLLAVGCAGLGLAVPTMTALTLDLARATPGLLFGFLFALEGAGHMTGPSLAAALSDVRLSLALVGAVLLTASLVALQVCEINEPALELAGDAG